MKKYLLFIMCVTFSVSVFSKTTYIVNSTADTPDNYQLNVFNQLEQIVLTHDKNTSSTQLDVSALSIGLNILNVNCENEGMQTIKFIKN